MHTSSLNLVRNGNFVEGFDQWDHYPRYPDAFATTYRGRSAMQCVRADGELLFQQRIDPAMPGRYVASAALATLKQPTRRFLMQVLMPGVNVDLRVQYFKADWEGHWVEFDVVEGGIMMIQITSPRGSEIFFTDLAVRRLGDL